MNRRNPTVFEKVVYDAVSSVPRGMVTTYKLLGEGIGCRSAQAVGQALRRNPFAPRVPCHRVISSDLTIGGYSGKTGGVAIRKKHRLLQREGVAFEKHKSGLKLADRSAVYRFD